MLLLLGFKNYSKNIYLDLSPTFMFWKLMLTLNVIIPHCFFKNNGGKGTDWSASHHFEQNIGADRNSKKVKRDSLQENEKNVDKNHFYLLLNLIF